jgi:hypothetical protein
MPRLSASLLVLAAALASPAIAAPEASNLDPALKINQIQVLGTHNSYAMPVDERLLNLADPILGRVTSQLSTRLPPSRWRYSARNIPTMSASTTGSATSTPTSSPS